MEKGDTRPADYPRRSIKGRFMMGDVTLTLEELRSPAVDLADPEIAAEFLRRYSGGGGAPGDRDQRTIQAPGHIANMADKPGFDQNHAAELDD